MERFLKQQVEDGIEDILKDNKYERKDLFYDIIHYLLENETINLNEVKAVSDELEEAISTHLNDVDKKLVESNGDIIPIIQSGMKEASKIIKTFVKRIDEMKNGHYHSNSG